MKEFEELEAELAKARVDAEAFFKKGNASAGTRLRKSLMDFKNRCHELRAVVTETKNKK